MAALADGADLIELGAEEAFPAEADPIDSDRVEAAAAKAASSLIR